MEAEGKQRRFRFGGNSGHTLVLINGVKAMSATFGLADLNFLPASLVERIEIIRGPRVVQYGADAISGVINIITKPEKGTRRNRLTAGAGQNGYWQGRWNIVHSAKNTQLHSAINAEHSDGCNIMPTHPPAHDYGYHTEQGVFGITHQFNEQWQGDIRALLSEGHSDYNENGTFLSASSLGKTILNQQFYDSGIEYEGSHYTSQMSLNYGIDDSRTEGESSSRIVTQRYAGHWLNRWQLFEDWHVNAGVDARQTDVGKSVTVYDIKKRYNFGEYSTLGFYRGVYQSEASIRQDHNQRYSNNTNYSLAGGWYYLPEQQIK
ncbi:MAG: Vitamin B12 transporter BtuB [Candidatus Celerinatantimonas neptuna]|nr:MAG: Vitamin B12 transporter BtuB [Candidatus Celerinatantimonas neptuna]